MYIYNLEAPPTKNGWMVFFFFKLFFLHVWFQNAWLFVWPARIGDHYWPPRFRTFERSKSWSSGGCSRYGWPMVGSGDMFTLFVYQWKWEVDGMYIYIWICVYLYNIYVCIWYQWISVQYIYIIWVVFFSTGRFWDVSGGWWQMMIFPKHTYTY